MIEPRQNGKGAILEARSLAGLYLLREQLILWTAHEFKTAREGFLRLRALVDNYDHLRKRVKAIRVAAGEEGIELLNGCRLRFLARSGGSGRGFSGDCVFLDEAYDLTDEQMAALMPTMSARPNPQLWYTSSAPKAESLVLRRLCKRGRADGAAGLAYFEWCVDRDAASDDKAAWAQANPAFGIRIGEEDILRELGSMGEYEFRRERLGIWFEEDADQVVDAKVWAEKADPKSKPRDPVAFALDITPDRTSTVIGVAGFRDDDRRHGELVDQLPGTRRAVKRLAELTKRWDTCAVVLDGNSPAAALIPDLAKVGIVLEPDTRKGEVQLVVVGGAQMTGACGGWYDALHEDRIRHMDQEPVNTALAGAKQRPMGDGGWKWSRKDSSINIGPLVVLTLADYGLVLYGESEEAADPWMDFG